MEISEELKNKLVENYDGVLIAGRRYPPNKLPREFHNYVKIDISAEDLSDLEELVEEIDACYFEKAGDKPIVPSNPEYKGYTDLGDILGEVFRLGLEKIREEQNYGDEVTPFQRIVDQNKQYIDDELELRSSNQDDA